MKNVRTFDEFINESEDILTVSLTSSSAKSFEKELKNNNISYTKKRPTVFTVKNSPKIRMAIRLTKERFGTQSVILKESRYSDSETGLIVYPRTREDNHKLTMWIDDSDYHAEWDHREGFWLFPEEEENYDELEAELEDEFRKADIQVRFEGVFK